MWGEYETEGNWFGWVTLEKMIAAEKFFNLESSAYEIARANPQAYGTKLHYFVDNDRNTACGLNAPWDVGFLIYKHDNDKCKRCLIATTKGR